MHTRSMLRALCSWLLLAVLCAGLVVGSPSDADCAAVFSKWGLPAKPTGVVGKAGSLHGLVHNDALTAIFVSGKGGVGKTTTSSSLAVQLAERRKALGQGPVLLVSTDPAHSLSDSFAQQFGSKPVAADGVDNLFVAEVNPVEELRKEVEAWKAFARRTSSAEVAGIAQAVQWLTSVPGIDESVALASILREYEAGAYSMIIFDTAPTGHTLKLLNMPQVIEQGLEMMDTWGSKIFKFVGTMGGSAGTGNPEDEFRARLFQHKKDAERLKEMIIDPEESSFVIVAIAETLSVAESQRLAEELQQKQIPSTHMVINQLLSTPLSETELAKVLETTKSLQPHLAARVEAQLQHIRTRARMQLSQIANLKKADSMLRCHAIAQIPQLTAEPVGPTKLREFAQLLITDPSEREGVHSPVKTDL